MSARYVPVTWNRSKLVYDAILLAAIVLYLLLYLRLGPALQHGARPIDDQTLAIKAWGSCGFLLLSAVLAIGPLCRLDPRFLPLLYNRRHFGVLTCTVAAGHANAVLSWYFAYSSIPPVEALLGADTAFGQAQGFPFILFGIAGFSILCVLAVTSHDFWLAFLTPPVWKAMHMSIYIAYACIALHVALGVLQDAGNGLLGLVVMASVLSLCTLHVAAAFRERARDSAAVRPDLNGWSMACDVADIAEGRAVVVRPVDGEPVAIFRDRGRFSAVSHACAHQNGPLGEGRVIDGCITCPWHGYQYRLEDGCAPPPFTEKLATYNLRLDGQILFFDPRPNVPGTRVEPVVLDEATA